MLHEAQEAAGRGEAPPKRAVLEFGHEQEIKSLGADALLKLG
jgi:hypothetical protein